ncbi:MarR family winged helix-turn-helix transcriptional regulator [Nakamurella leprariae]|uniref:MarR family transcriptional regulator n=1 Tax=Nakamurella leprariae TaxID=2803911 RepID=A0A938YHP4_9ACTN|nr:MarR family transcriptional regulator [Nakamurella leprariae]MBM9468547.1 MarR family transcriptional regulator [Nakamurella leprariae]
MTDDFGRRLTYLFRRVNGALSQRLDRILKGFSLTQAQLSALALLDAEPSGTLSGAELSDRSGVTPQSMSAAVAGLLDRGLVVRTPHPSHGRILQIHLTAAGSDLLHQVQAESAVDDEAAGLDRHQEDQLRALLRQMMRALDLYLPPDDAD